MVNEFLTRLRDALKRPGITKRSLTRDAGLHKHTLLGCERDDWDPKMSTIRKLEAVLPPLELTTDQIITDDQSDPPIHKY